MARRTLRLFLIFILHITWIYAQNEDTAQIRIIHTQRSPHIQVYFDETPFAGDFWSENAFRPQWIYPYLAFPEGEYDLAVIAEGDTLIEAMAESVSVEGEHRYTLIIYETNPIRYIWIDETAILDGQNFDEESVYILVNLIDDAPPISVVIDGEKTLSDVAYGEFALGIDPPSPVSGVEVMTADGNVVASYSDVETHIQGAYILTIYDFFPGYGYAGLSIPQYAGELTFNEALDVTLDEMVEGEITRVGERNQYEFHLDTDTIIDATLLRTIPTQRSFPSGMNLRIYNEARELLWQDDNDEQQTRLYGFELSAGSYILEVGTMGDADTATYSLIIYSE